MPRKILALACVVVGLHIIEALTLGTSTLGSFLANGLQIFACGLAVAMAFGACRRGRGLSRPFWLILGAGVALPGVATLGRLYYEVVLHSEPPSTSVVRFLLAWKTCCWRWSCSWTRIRTLRGLTRNPHSTSSRSESSFSLFMSSFITLRLAALTTTPPFCGKCALRTWKTRCSPCWLHCRCCVRGSSIFGNSMEVSLSSF